MKKRKNINKEFKEYKQYKKDLNSDDPYNLNDEFVREKVNRRRLKRPQLKYPKLYNEET